MNARKNRNLTNPTKKNHLWNVNKLNHFLKKILPKRKTQRLDPGSDVCIQFSSVQSLSCVQLCDPVNCSTLGLLVHHQLLEFTQTHVHRVGDAIQPSHPLLSPSPPAPNPSQHQGLFQ